jgi:hypothetical protein
VTAEYAVALPAVVLLIALVLSLVAASGARISALDAARAGARVAALGWDDGAIADAARRVSDAAEVAVARDGLWVTITVTSPFPHINGLPMRVTASAVAWVEP